MLFPLSPAYFTSVLKVLAYADGMRLNGYVFPFLKYYVERSLLYINISDLFLQR